jgi:hypothetical protein
MQGCQVLHRQLLYVACTIAPTGFGFGRRPLILSTAEFCKALCDDRLIFDQRVALVRRSVVSPVPAGRQHERPIYHCQSRSLR